MSLKTENRIGPLNGVKILDFTRTYAGPFATMLLADLGATVIKVESPDGDPSRQLGPYLDNETKDYGLGGFNSSVNRNKKSVALNLTKPKAQKIAQELAKECNAIILNFSTPKIMAKFNLDYDTVKELNPKLVYVSISGYGTNKIVPSEFEGKPTIDLMMQAESGTLSITGSQSGEMYKVGPGIGDSFTGTLAVTALLAGLLHAKNTGEGQFIDIAMLDSMVLLSERIVYQYAYTGVSPKPIGNRHPLQSPYSLYHTSDGAIVLAAFPDRYWDKLVEALNIPGFKEDSRFTDKSERLAHQDELDKIIEKWTMSRTKKEAMEILDKYGCLAAPVNKAEDLFNNKQIEEREMLMEVEGNPVTKQKVKIVGTPYNFSKTKAQIYNRAPLIGENTLEVLKQLNYTDDQISKLIEDGTVVVNKI